MRNIFSSRAQKSQEDPAAEHLRAASEFQRAHFLEQSKAALATTKEYVDWLEEYFKKGGSISSAYSGDMSIFKVYTVQNSAPLPALYGAASLNIIVPEGIHIPLEDPNESFHGFGHSSLYLSNGTASNGTSDRGAVLYQDSVIELKHRGYSLDRLESLYDGPEWNRCDDMETLKEAYSGAEATRIEQITSPALRRDMPAPKVLRIPNRNGL
jgi:hypothetical protein